MKKLFLTLSLMLALTLLSCSTEDVQTTNDETNQLALRTSQFEFDIVTDVDIAAEGLGEDLTNLYDIKNRTVHSDEKESELGAFDVWDNIENARQSIRIKCFKFTSPSQQSTHSIVDINGTELSIFGWKKQDGTWSFIVYTAFSGETC